MLHLIAKCLLRLGGWTAVGEKPAVRKAVFIAAPHTSNWDGIWALIYKVSIDLDVHFFAKQSLFWFPLSTLLRWLGGIPLNRSEPGSAVRQAVDTFNENDEFYLALAPEGTRSLRSHWKSGFYRIAMEANVPVVLGFFDYRRKRIGMGPIIELSGDRDADLATMQEFYGTKSARWPEKASPIVFKNPL